MRLNELADNDHALISGVNDTRLQNLGIVPNKIVKVLRRNATCLHIQIGLTEWIIRKDYAESVNIIPR